jgi:hypothetical protein
MNVTLDQLYEFEHLIGEYCVGTLAGGSTTITINKLTINNTS